MASDRRIRFLTQRVDLAEVLDPEAPRNAQVANQVFFGATVRYSTATGEERTATIVGVDELDLKRGHISWLSPLARAMLKSRPGDTVVLRAPGGDEDIRVIEVRYERVEVEPFAAPER
jgi:transcription elongation factor GreB